MEIKIMFDCLVVTPLAALEWYQAFAEKVSTRQKPQEGYPPGICHQPVVSNMDQLDLMLQFGK